MIVDCKMQVQTAWLLKEREQISILNDSFDFTYEYRTNLQDAFLNGHDFIDENLQCFDKDRKTTECATIEFIGSHEIT